MRSIFVSAAKWCIVLNSNTLCSSLINNMKMRSPRTNPCGTQYFNSHFNLADCVLLILVNCILSLRNERNRLLPTPLIPEWCSPLRSILCFIISKAFCKSRNTRQAYLPNSQPCLTFSVICNSACVVEWLCQNPNCLSHNILCLLTLWSGYVSAVQKFYLY